jgi:serine/threonine protein phosphatase PrpC
MIDGHINNKYSKLDKDRQQQYIKEDHGGSSIIIVMFTNQLVYAFNLGLSEAFLSNNWANDLFCLSKKHNLSSKTELESIENKGAKIESEYIDKTERA